MSKFKRKSNRQLIIVLIIGAVGMFGFGFALVPLYDVLCDALGINGKTQSTASVYQSVVVDESRTVTIEFMSQVQSDMPWTFTPQVNTMQVHPGELIRTHFVATNISGQHIIGQAIPSVSPGQGAAYFNKTECFCFNQQVLKANAAAELPLIFFVDPQLPESISTLTLSYTLYNITDKGYVTDIASNAVEQGAEQ
ncbi:cytochrome c oxidase assembly protein [Shewanella schlegeliana]|uniref:Cytochrome c oxidase assembly protein CtaG n=1 Tax=Shewanella schlegeliana TaxID=190308 RepID=A0ABS1T472_9GAMM|nr:cytochrome c oxidase assembly protein [Shewanella schlegeliana]MBL4914642.1 cytochrome c oxidase assembly protein [Shewanella schlegeliana]MCL1109542.1 cytochrome c oxidase assembly protein [Shewanella schlegeliana]GIU29628.1 cytochrome c oxidase assembly protein [Shewanella schlegeliana]